MNRFATRTLLSSLFAAIAFTTVAPADAEAGNGRRALQHIGQAVQFFRHVEENDGDVSVNVHVGVQGGGGACHQGVNQSADINLAFVRQRCDDNSANVSQDGFFNHTRVNQR